MVVTLTEQEFQEMKRILLDEDGKEALQMLHALVKRIEQSARGGMKSHLDG